LPQVGQYFLWPRDVAVAPAAPCSAVADAQEVLADLRPRLPKLAGLIALVCWPCVVCWRFRASWALIASGRRGDGGLCPDVPRLLGGFVTVVWLWVQWSLAARRWCWRSRSRGRVEAFRETRTRYVVRVFGIQLVAILLASIVG